MDSDSSTAATRAWRRAEAIFSWLAFFAAAAQSALMFRYSETDGVTLAVGAKETGAWLSVVVPTAAAYGWIVALPVATVAHAFREARRSRSLNPARGLVSRTQKVPMRAPPSAASMGAPA